MSHSLGSIISKANISAIVRSEEQVQKLQHLGVNVILADLLNEHAVQDIVHGHESMWKRFNPGDIGKKSTDPSYFVKLMSLYTWQAHTIPGSYRILSKPLEIVARAPEQKHILFM